MLRNLEKYEVLDEIGHGGMATVYRARDARLDRLVAIKVLHPHLREAEEARSRFAREARSVARLKHAHILEIYDYSGEGSSESYIATELLTGPTLKRFAEAHPEIPAEIAACFVIQILQALAAAHAQGIVHRDVKPENVLLHEDRCVKLTDFGIAQIVDAQSFTATGQILGSPGHMAPEQILGDDCDARTDLFSTGTVLYYLAVGRLPFPGRNPHQILKRIVDGDYPDPLRLRPSIGGELRRILVKALARRPEDRYPSAEAFERDLVAFVRAAGIEDPASALSDYLKDPGGVAAKLRTAVIDRLTRRGESRAKANDVPGALDDWNRVLALDEGNARVLGLLDQLGRAGARRRTRMIVAGAVLGLSGLAATGYAVFGVERTEPSSRVAEPVEVAPRELPKGSAPAAVVKAPEPPALGDPGSPATEHPSSSEETSPPEPVAVESPRPVGTANREDRSRAPSEPRVGVGTGPRTIVFRPSPQNVLIGIDDAAPRPFGPSFHRVDLSPGVHRFKFIGAESCCVDEEFTVNVPAGPGTTVVERSLAFRPAGLYVVANVPADVRVEGRDVHGRAREVLRVPMPESIQDVVRVIVTAPGHRDYTGVVKLRAGRIAELEVTLEALGSGP